MQRSLEALDSVANKLAANKRLPMLLNVAPHGDTARWRL